MDWTVNRPNSASDVASRNRTMVRGRAVGKGAESGRFGLHDDEAIMAMDREVHHVAIAGQSAGHAEGV